MGFAKVFTSTPSYTRSDRKCKVNQAYLLAGKKVTDTSTYSMLSVSLEHILTYPQINTLSTGMVTASYLVTSNIVACVTLASQR